MATLTGKKARRTGGNRYACKRANRKRNPVKLARWQEGQDKIFKGGGLTVSQQKTKEKYGL